MRTPFTGVGTALVTPFTKTGEIDETAVRRLARRQIEAGVYNTKEVVQLARELAKAGAAGLLSVTPYYNKPTQEGLYQHYCAIAESTPLPIIVYNVPGRTATNVETATLLRLAAI